ncbi:unnamed protein product, partial [Ranitomeya imitator]
MFTLVTRGLRDRWSLESCLCDSSPATKQQRCSDPDRCRRRVASFRRIRRKTYTDECQFLLHAFDKALSCLEEIPAEEHKEICQRYILCLSKLPHEESKLKEICDSTATTYPSFSFPLEVLSMHYIKSGSSRLFVVSVAVKARFLGFGKVFPGSASSAVTLRSEGAMTWLVHALCLNVRAEDAEDGAAPEQSQAYTRVIKFSQFFVAKLGESAYTRVSLYSSRYGDVSEEAATCYNKLVEMEPCNGPGLIGIGVKALHDKKYDMAAEILSRAIKVLSQDNLSHVDTQQKDRALGLKAQALLQCTDADHSDEILKILEQISNIDDDLVLTSLKSQVYLKKGSLEEASKGRSFLPVYWQVVTMDASLLGWGVVFRQLTVQEQDSSLPIIVLEIRAIFLSLRHWERILRGLPIRIQTDNATAVAYVNHQGGTRRSLAEVCRKLQKTHHEFAETYFLEGQLHYTQKNYTEADKSFHHAIEKNPENANYYFCLGLTYWFMSEESKRDKTKAVTQFLK